MMELFLTIMAFVLLVVLPYNVGQDSVKLDKFVPKYMNESYCIESKATVADKTITLKRCFKIIEVPNE